MPPSGVSKKNMFSNVKRNSSILDVRSELKKRSSELENLGKETSLRNTRETQECQGSTVRETENDLRVPISWLHY